MDCYTRKDKEQMNGDKKFPNFFVETNLDTTDRLHPLGMCTYGVALEN